MKVTKYQLSKYSDPRPGGGYGRVTICGSFDSYLSALLYKILMLYFGYRIEKFEVDTDLFKEN